MSKWLCGFESHSQIGGLLTIATELQQQKRKRGKNSKLNNYLIVARIIRNLEDEISSVTLDYKYAF